MRDLKSIIKYSHSLKLLYVEDNEDARVSTLGILSEFFDDIIIGFDGVDGLEKFKLNDIDLIITDINMPKMNGLDMIAAIRAFDKNTSILVLSAHNEPSYFMDSIKLGVEGYVLKPIDLDQLLSILSNVIDKYKGVKNQELLKQYKEITDKSAVISIIDTEGLITYVNDAFCKISEYTKDELIGTEYSTITNFNQSDILHKEIWDTIKTKKQIWQGVVKNVSKYGKPYYLKTTIKPILDTKGNIIEYIALRNDITAIMSPTKQLNDLIESATIPMVILIKIADFEDIEKFYGQKLIREIENKFANEISNFLPNGCEFEKIFTLRNGEYALSKDKMQFIKSNKDVIENLKTFRDRVNATHIDIGEIEYDISVLISFAYGDNALENAKHGIKNLLESKQDFIFANNFAQQEYDEAKENLKTLKMIKKAIENSKIVSYFQPIINNKTLKIEKYESLVRLIKDDEVLLPAKFLEKSKRGKYYSQITSIVLDNSFRALKSTDKEISINLSILDIEKKLIRDKIFLLLEVHNDIAHRVVFELLEDEDSKDFEVVKSFIERVKQMGVKIAIDDFGSGYSNFERLLDYKPDILKLDGSLIKNIDKDKLSLSIVKNIVTFAKEQNLKVIAEYVATKEIFDILCSLDVDYSQGYYFAKPDILLDDF